MALGSLEDRMRRVMGRHAKRGTLNQRNAGEIAAKLAFKVYGRPLTKEQIETARPLGHSVMREFIR
jgi:hypothetical protein